MTYLKTLAVPNLRFEPKQKSCPEVSLLVPGEKWFGLLYIFNSQQAKVHITKLLHVI